ncbi:MAG: NAD(P)-dependent oxidoreductase [Candidatus Aenigmatarchaeota archaeon]
MIKITEKQTILITGGAGYLGSVITEYFLQRNYRVIVYDNLLYNQQSLFNCVHFPDFHFVYGDVRNYNLLKQYVEKADIIFPLAAIVGAPACEKVPEVTYAVNQHSIEWLAKQIKPHQKVVFPCTNSGYGTKSGEIYCTEETPLEPISTYGISKVNAEKALLEMGNAVTLRLATVFGFSPRMRLDLLVNDFVFKAVNDRYIVLFEKDFKRNYLHIRDVPRVFEHAINNYENMKGEAYNVGIPDANLSKEELALRIKKFIPDLFITYSEFNKDPDRRNYIISNEKLLKTGFKFKYTLDDGIQELIKGYKILRFNQFKNI